MGFDLEYYDVLEDINGIDKKKVFCDMIRQLNELGAHIAIYQNSELITLELLDNWLETIEETRKQIEDDIDRELEG